MIALRDLDTRAEIHDLVVAFYREIVFDELPWPGRRPVRPAVHPVRASPAQPGS